MIFLKYQAKRTNAEYAELVEKSEAQKHVEERKQKRLRTADESSDSRPSIQDKARPGLDLVSSSQDGERKGAKRIFKQSSAVAEQHGEKEAKINKKLMAKVFAKRSDE
jgi:hypothetical protein